MGDPVTAAIVISTGAQIYGTYTGGQAAKKEADYNAKVAKNNQKIAKEQGKDIAIRGAVGERTLEQDALRFADSQLLAVAGAGIDISSGVAQTAIEDTARITAADIIRLKHNVKKDVWATEVGISSSLAETELGNIRARSAERAANIETAAAIAKGIGSYYAR